MESQGSPADGSNSSNLKRGSDSQNKGLSNGRPSAHRKVANSGGKKLEDVSRSSRARDETPLPYDARAKKKTKD